jgi:flagellar biosynthesis/type III secretory pathway M-ring protein FliF/YscJ
MVLVALGLVALISVAGFFAWDRHQVCTALVEGDLRKYHATDIVIKLDWFDFDKDTFTYDVEYRDRAGTFHRNRCKVTSHGYPADEAVYWTDPINPHSA